MRLFLKIEKIIIFIETTINQLRTLGTASLSTDTHTLQRKDFYYAKKMVAHKKRLSDLPEKLL